MSLNNKEDDTLNSPFFLSPAGKDYIWGGTKLKEDFGKDFDLEPLAETWECSTHPNGPSIVASGQYKGLTLSEVLKLHPEYLGSHPQCESGQIPVLIKFIDAKNDLSVQVHPSDEYAKEHENGSLGKTEMWYIIDASPEASLIYGFSHKVSKNQLKEAITKGTLEKHMNKVSVTKGDVFFIPSGTVHAIGRGCLIAEIQENSDLTYRLYDYNRIGKDGKLRPLHIDKALEVSKLEALDSPRQPMKVLRFRSGRASQLLARCKYFQTEKLIINTERVRNLADFRTDSSTFQVLLCYSGCGVGINELDGTAIKFFKGDCIFIPANSIPIKLHGKAEFLRIRC